MAVVHPVSFLRLKPLRCKLAFSAAAWVFILVFSAFYTLNDKMKRYVFVSKCVLYISPMLFCYFSVLRALKKPGPGEGKRERSDAMKQRAFINIEVIMVSFVATYLAWCVAIIATVGWQIEEEKRS